MQSPTTTIMTLMIITLHWIAHSNFFYQVNYTRYYFSVHCLFSAAAPGMDYYLPSALLSSFGLILFFILLFVFFCWVGLDPSRFQLNAALAAHMHSFEFDYTPFFPLLLLTCPRNLYGECSAVKFAVT